MSRFFSRRRFLGTSLAVGTASLLGCFIARGQRPETPTLPDQEMKPIIAPPVKQASHAKRIREGTAFKGMLVSFSQNGDRTVLYTVEDNQRYTCHENLTLERILAIPDRQYWKVTGEFAEFRGENFVTIRHATVASLNTP